MAAAQSHLNAALRYTGDPALDTVLWLPESQPEARIRYAADSPLQFGDLRLPHRPPPPGGYPVAVFVHGGGWQRGDKRLMLGSAKLRHWQAAGYAVASLNYRLVPDATVEQQAADVASAVAYLKANAGGLGFDARRIALVGHSAGGPAHRGRWP